MARDYLDDPTGFVRNEPGALARWPASLALTPGIGCPSSMDAGKLDNGAGRAMNEPRSIGRLVAATFELYRCYPWLFLALATAVIVPYELCVLVLTGSAGFGYGDASFALGQALSLLSWFLIAPLVSALHIHAVAAVKDDRKPQIGTVARQGLRVLPVVVATAIVSGIGITLGYFALLIPGVYLMLRWVVVVQVAAVEHDGWLPALRRGSDLSDGHYAHVFIFVIVVGVIASGPSTVGVLLANGSSSAPVILLGLAVTIITTSFAALATALLYYDLVARWEVKPQGDSALSTGQAPRQTWDPRYYSDQARPKGWYVNPSDPKRMSHWGGPEIPEWNGTARTPRKIKRAWESEGHR